MLITFDKTSTRGAYGGTSDSSRLNMRDDGGNISRNSIQLRPDHRQASNPVAWSRVEENDQASILSRCDHGDAEFRDSVVFYVLGFLFLTPLILAGIAVKFG